MKKKKMLITLAIIFISFLSISLSIVYFGDDYYFLQFKDYNFTTYFEKLFYFYQHANGRLIVHLLDTLILRLPTYFWSILNAIMLLGICYFNGKIISDKNSYFYTIIMFFFLSALDIDITRQSVWWITGSFNYTYPLFMLSLYCFCLFKLNKTGKIFPITCLCAFLAAASVEQVGMMTFGLTVLIILSKIQKEFKLKTFIMQNKKLILLFFITLVGLLTVIAAPSQFSRFSTSSDGSSIFYTVFKNVKLIFKNYTSTTNILPYAILYNLFAFLIIKKQTNHNLFENFLIASIPISMLEHIICIIFMNTVGKNFFVAILSIHIILYYCVSLFYLNKIIYNKLFSPLTITAILLVGSQFMMIISPILGDRNFLCGLVSFAIIISMLAKKASLSNKSIKTLSYLLLVFALSFNAVTLYNYKITNEEHAKNVAIIKNNTNDTVPLILYKFSTEKYCWNTPYVNSYYTKLYQKQYNFTNEIIWIEAES